MNSCGRRPTTVTSTFLAISSYAADPSRSTRRARSRRYYGLEGTGTTGLPSLGALCARGADSGGDLLSCRESGETLLADMREIGPTYLIAPPRILEPQLTGVSTRMADVGRAKRWPYDSAMELAQSVGVYPQWRGGPHRAAISLADERRRHLWLAATCAWAQ